MSYITFSFYTYKTLEGTIYLFSFYSGRDRHSQCGALMLNNVKLLGSRNDKSSQFCVRTKQKNISGVMLPIFEWYTEGANGPNDYKIVALSEQIPLLNSFFYFEVEILNKGNDRQSCRFLTYNYLIQGVACYIPKDLENSKTFLYPCELRSQGGSIEVNFDHQLNNEFALMYRRKAHLIMEMYKEALEDSTEVFEIKQDNLVLLTYRRKVYFILGEYEKAFADLTKVLESEPENVIARRYRGEIDQIMGESYNDITELLKFNPNDFWAINVCELVEKMYDMSTYKLIFKGLLKL
ncbi:hypothetical protein C2G38_2040622 [Gigaspora rosea]|uniref:Uncharacterized protein n=1 Tax=Gigaspora rosea TaxID=44941 RepID=A0A397UW78_9GLOM|nr:hypothetical protein C2G38_2040622 [Gigaspora rosea]